MTPSDEEPWRYIDGLGCGAEYYQPSVGPEAAQDRWLDDASRQRQVSLR